MKFGCVRQAARRAVLVGIVACGAAAVLMLAPSAVAGAAPPATSAAAQAPCVVHDSQRMCFAGGAWWRCSPIKNVKNKAARAACEASAPRKPGAKSKGTKTQRPEA